MKAAIVGCGFVSQFHVKTWKELGVEIVGLCDLNEKAVRDLAVTHSSSAFLYSDWERMLGELEIDVVSVCTPPSSHAEIIRAALDKGCKVAVEKPFTMSSAEACEFQNSKDVTIIHNQVFNTFFHQALMMLKHNILGKIYEVRVSTMASPEDHMTRDPNHWSHKLKGGRLTECLPHPIYIAQFFSGIDNLQVEQVFVKKRGSSPAKTDELTAILYASDVRAVLNVRLNALGSVASVDVYGEEGMMKAAIIPRALSLHSYGGSRMDRWRKKRLLSSMLKLKIKGSDRYLILNALLQGDPLVSASHGFYNMKILEDLVNLQ